LSGQKKYEIKKLMKRLKEFKRKSKIERVILFGSFARGDFGKDSDVDLILIDKKFRKKGAFERSKGFWIKWHVKHKIPYPVDFLCYTPEEFEEKRKRIGIVSESVEEGVEIF